MVRKWVLLIALVLSGISASFGQTAPPTPEDGAILRRAVGTWAGTLERGGSVAEIRLDLEMRGDELVGTFDWPELGYLGFDVIGAVVRDGVLRISLPLPLGALRLRGTPGRARLAGQLEETTLRANEWVTLPAEGSFLLRRSERPRTPYGVTAVTFASGAVQIAGSIYSPSASGQRPAVVFIAGSGDASRADGAYYADQFARAGIVTLVYDKRGVGESQGDWRQGGYEELAQDAFAAHQLLRGQRGVDMRRVGYVARSEGAWVAPLAVRMGGAAFLAVVSGPVVSVSDEDLDYYRVALQEASASQADMDDALNLLRMRHAVIAGRASRAELDIQLARARSASWFPVLHWDDAEATDQIFRRHTIDFDPAPHLRELGVPSLWLYGTDDTIIPAGDSIARLVSLRIEPRPHMIVLPRADHALAVQRYPSLPGGVAGAGRLLADWINGL